MTGDQTPDARQRLVSWGGTTASVSTVVARIPSTSDSRGLLARGSGLSYGDAAQNAGGTVVAPQPGGLVTVDQQERTATAAASVTLREVVTATLPLGLLPWVTPGTLKVSIGGALAADVHGKNHHRVGSFGAHVRSLTLAAPLSGSQTLTPEDAPAFFWATVGGMGLTGIIESASVGLRQVETGWLRVSNRRCSDLAEVMSRMVGSAAEHVSAWIDLRAGGRGILTLADHASRDMLVVGAPIFPLDTSRRMSLPAMTPRLIWRNTVWAHSQAKYRLAPDHETSLRPLWTALYPLDGIAGWQHAYGRDGVVQYQFVARSASAVSEVVRTIGESKVCAFLGVLKRMGDGNPGPLSFPLRGWTLAVDFPVQDRLAGLLQDLDAIVLHDRGRVYLAKDGRLSPAALRGMYPRLDEWKAIRGQMDPARRMQSDLGRRLELCGDA